MCVCVCVCMCFSSSAVAFIREKLSPELFWSSLCVSCPVVPKIFLLEELFLLYCRYCDTVSNVASSSMGPGGLA